MPHARPRHLVLAAVLALLVAAVAISPHTGRAHPTSAYRPALSPAALDTGCYPLPPGVHLGLPVQVRTDEDLPGGEVRRLRLQYDLVSDADAAADVTTAFTRAGWSRSAGAAGSALFRKAGQSVAVTVTPLPRRLPGSIVRGTITLLLPRTPRASAAEVCDDRFATKRFADEELTP